MRYRPKSTFTFTIMLNVVWMEREFDAYKLSRSMSWPLRVDATDLCCLRDLMMMMMYPSIFNSFPDIRTASAKNRRFHVPQPQTYRIRSRRQQRSAARHFCFPGGAPATITQYIAWMESWKDNSMLAKPLAARTYLSSIVSELYDA